MDELGEINETVAVGVEDVKDAVQKDRVAEHHGRFEAPLEYNKADNVQLVGRLRVIGNKGDAQCTAVQVPIAVLLTYDRLRSRCPHSLSL